MNALYNAAICDGKGLKSISQEFPSNSLCLFHKVKYQGGKSEGDSIISQMGFKLQFIKFKEQEKGKKKKKKSLLLQRLNYPDK